ncbi:hypothetical protein NIES4071_105610 (plasmid) [Calothrix sp. NIES-4071]|nr:hypothetical protein NIES4071_105610 [Calothrix sp. NIES-4071]BAZ64979.1 hypothetical protein NIES4105_107120 [Calothrix sp. NIES-4105]
MLAVSLENPINQAFSVNSYISEAHFQEWVESGVDPEIIKLNVKSLVGDEVYQYLIPDPGAVTKRVHPDAQWRSIRARYGHLENGGWWVDGADPLNGYTLNQWGSFKPDTPRNKHNGFAAVENKFIKYEHPFGVTMRAIFLNVPLHIWEKISERYEIPLPLRANFISIYSDSVDEYVPSISFWEWVYKNNIPVTIVEGAKKAGALLTAGYVAIALPGIFAGYRKSRILENGAISGRALIPDLQHFSTPRREINICFDYEDRPAQIKSMEAAINGLYFLLLEKGCDTRITCLPGKEKGVDDFIVAHGVGAYEKIHAALTYDQWVAWGLSRLTGVSVCINQEFLGAMQLPVGEKLVAIKSPKGTGKTELLISIVALRISLGLPTILITHRIQLGQSICGRIGLDYVTEMGDGARTYFGFGLCVDSLHPESQAQFNAENWKDALVIVDECEQVFWHTLTASTEIKKHRTEVIDQLGTLFKNALTSKDGGVILLDADLSNLSIDFVLGLAEIDIKPWVVLNEWKPVNGRSCFSYEKSTQMLAVLEDEIHSGKKVFVITQSQKAKSKFGTINLEARWRQLFPNLRILRIDSDSVREPGHPALGCISKLNQILTQYDIVICSPTIETGVSIDIKGHFSSVWAFFQGVSPVNSACQAVARLRELVPLHIYAASRGLSFAGNQSTSYKALISGQNKVFKSTLSLIGFDGNNYTINGTALTIWGKMGARVNAGMKDYNTSILAALSSEGHTVIEAPEENLPSQSTEKQIASELKARKENNYIDYCNEVASQDISEMTISEYEALLIKKAKTQQERYIEKKYELSQRYSVDVNADLVAADDDGFYPAIRLHYYLTVGRPYLLERDKKVIEKMLSEASNRLFIPDFNRSTWSASVATLEVLGIGAILAQSDRTFRGNDEDMQVLLSKAIQYRNQIKDLLGVQISKNATAIQVLRQILKKLGLKLLVGGRDGAGHRQRFYTIKNPNDGREEIFSKWLAKHEASNTN